MADRCVDLLGMGLGAEPLPEVVVRGVAQEGRRIHDVLSRISAGQSVYDVFVEVLVYQERDQGINPFAGAASRSSLLGPGRCDASILRRTASASSSHRRRYSDSHVRANHRATRSDGGVACIRGLRIPVATVVSMVADAMTPAEILAAYPDLEAEDIREALRFAAESVRERELPLVTTVMKFLAASSFEPIRFRSLPINSTP